MKQYTPLLLLIILLTSCVPKVEVEEAQQVEEPKEIIEEELKEPEAEEIIIEIKEDSFSPAEKTIKRYTEIKWVKKDKRDYKIVCYLKGTRVIQSPDLKEGGSFTHFFLKEGEYTCITTPYGIRSKITVEAEAPFLSPTGSAVMDGSAGIKGTSLAATALIAIVVLLFFIYGRKRK